jgi:hypothetical protein
MSRGCCGDDEIGCYITAAFTEFDVTFQTLTYVKINVLLYCVLNILRKYIFSLPERCPLRHVVGPLNALSYFLFKISQFEMLMLVLFYRINGLSFSTKSEELCLRN